MWSKLKNKVIDWGSSAIAATMALFIGLLAFLIPITSICGCIKLITMMFGG